MRRAIGYPRVSTEEQAKEGISLDAQVAKIRAYADLYQITLVAFEADEGVSAKTLDRPGLERALAMLDRDEADGIIVTKLDRLSRDVGDWSHLIKNYFDEKSGKKLWSVNDSIDTSTASGRMVLNMLMTVAQWERETIAERTRDSLRFKIATNSRCGKLRFGSELDPTDPRVSRRHKNPVGLIPNPSEVEAIELMKRWREHGQSLRKIAEELTARGIPTRDGVDKWDHSTVRKILKRA